MPELPEVETTRSGIEPHLTGRRVAEVRVRQPSLRWEIPSHLKTSLPGRVIESVERRGKYLLIGFDCGVLLVHLGMSGSLRIVDGAQTAGRHDHFDLVLDDGRCLRLTDPRRFGAVLWQAKDELHPLLEHLGPEPLSDAFDVDYLCTRAVGRKTTIKAFIMDSKVVVGVGNIYANEALFAAGIHPRRAAGRVSKARMALLVQAIRQVLAAAIAQGGTTLKDFVGGDGKPGYFKQSLNVYGRGGMPCVKCGDTLKEIRLGQRSTVYCPNCQR